MWRDQPGLGTPGICLPAPPPVGLWAWLLCVACRSMGCFLKNRLLCLRKDGETYKSQIGDLADRPGRGPLGVWAGVERNLL